MDWTDNSSHTMIASSGEVMNRKFKKLIGKSGKTWMVAIQDNEADNIYVSGGLHSQGMAGRTLEFKLVDGTTESIQGPWHSNVGALFNDTGLDVCNTSLTFGCIGLGRSYGDNGIHPVTIHDVLYLDKEWTLGSFDRVHDLAQQFADNIGKPIMYFVKSKGGSSCGQIRPTKTKVG